MTAAVVSDAELLQRAARGDTDAFDTLMGSHAPSVQRFLQTMGDRDSDDALQETFIAAWRSAGSYSGAGTVRSWLLSIARNVRRHQQRRRVDEPSTFVSLEDLAAHAGWGCDPAEARHQARALARDVLDRALSALPDDEHEVLVVRELDGLSGEETAALLQLSLPAMKSRLHRARIHLAAEVRRLDDTVTATGSDNGHA